MFSMPGQTATSDGHARGVIAYGLFSHIHTVAEIFLETPFQGVWRKVCVRIDRSE